MEVDGFFEPQKVTWSIDVVVDDHGQKLIKELFIEKAGRQKRLEFEDGARPPIEILGQLVLEA